MVELANVFVLKSKNMQDRILRPADLDESAEQERLLQNRGRGALYPYLSFDSRLPPLVLVHGIYTSAASMQTLADRIADQGIFQLYMFLYDDVNRYIDRIGDDLARALGVLPKEHGESARILRLAAHSMGGIVARAALNSMVHPGWFPEFHGSDEEGKPLRVRGTLPSEVADIRLERSIAHEFRAIDLITIDTPWHGFAEPSIQIRAKMDREASYIDMVSNSALFYALHRVSWPAHFSINHIGANNSEAGFDPDKVVALAELGEEDLNTLIGYFAGNEKVLEGRPRLFNQLQALISDRDFGALEQELRKRAASGTLTHNRLLGLFSSAVPHFAGSHSSVLDHPGLMGEILRTFERASREDNTGRP